MSLIIPVNGINPKLGENCFIAPNATIVGDVECGKGCSFWFSCVVRGDVNSIRMGDFVNVQDGAVIHGTYQRASTQIGNIGHRAIVHGCSIEDNVLIGMGAIVMDHAYIESGSLIAAGCVILEGMRVKSGSVYAGVPGKKIKDITPELFRGEVERIAKNYLLYSSWFKELCSENGKII